MANACDCWSNYLPEMAYNQSHIRVFEQMRNKIDGGKNNDLCVPLELFVACLIVVMEKVMTPLSLWLYRLYRLETTFVHTFMLGVVDCRLDRNSGLQNILYLHIASIPFVYSTILLSFNYILSKMFIDQFLLMNHTYHYHACWHCFLFYRSLEVLPLYMVNFKECYIYAANVFSYVCLPSE